jgi:prolyl-tRNA editing enzyme YbaK/EbsC (Cys-tRNA(Pro) deacylase)
MPIYVERTVLDLPVIYVNGGSRGFLVGVAPRALAALLSATPVDAAIER